MIIFILIMPDTVEIPVNMDKEVPGSSPDYNNSFAEPLHARHVNQTSETTNYCIAYIIRENFS